MCRRAESPRPSQTNPPAMTGWLLEFGGTVKVMLSGFLKFSVFNSQF